MWIYLLLMVYSVALLSLPLFLFIEIYYMHDVMDKPRATCERVNWWTPISVGGHWLINLLHVLYGHVGLSLIHLPLSLLYLHQYWRRVAESGRGYHNPVRFFSSRYLHGLMSFYIIVGVYHLLLVGAYYHQFFMAITNSVS